MLEALLFQESREDPEPRDHWWTFHNIQTFPQDSPTTHLTWRCTPCYSQIKLELLTHDFELSGPKACKKTQKHTMSTTGIYYDRKPFQIALLLECLRCDQAITINIPLNDGHSAGCQNTWWDVGFGGTYKDRPGLTIELKPLVDIGGPLSVFADQNT